MAVQIRKVYMLVQLSTCLQRVRHSHTTMSCGYIRFTQDSAQTKMFCQERTIQTSSIYRGGWYSIHLLESMRTLLLLHNINPICTTYLHTSKYASKLQTQVMVLRFCILSDMLKIIIRRCALLILLCSDLQAATLSMHRGQSSFRTS